MTLNSFCYPLLFFVISVIFCYFCHPILLSEWCIYHARSKKQRRVVLRVRPFAGVWSSGRKCASITIKAHFIVRAGQIQRSAYKTAKGSTARTTLC